MKALLLEEYKKLTVTDMPKPEVGEHDVLVQIKACGICGSDIHGFDGSSGRRIPPLIMGHEASGVVAQTGGDVTQVKEGDRVLQGEVVVELSGAAAGLLTAERTLLNFLQHLSGVATLTRQFVEAVAGTQCAITDTRKTLPGFRLLDKYAVVQGGGKNHRLGLDDGVLIKDNHIAVCGGVGAAVRQAHRQASPWLRIEVECTTLEEVHEALDAQADIILLDNMTTKLTSEAVHVINGRALVEASGNMSLDRVRAVAETGVDFISVGALTHSVSAADLSMALTCEVLTGGEPR